MNIWNTNQLVSQLQTGPLPQSEQFKYFLAYSLFIAIIMEIPYTPDEPYSMVDYLSAFSSILITVLGALLIYRVNSSGDDAEFLPRVIALSLPISVRLMVFGLPIGLIFFGITDSAGLSTDWFALVFTYVYCGFFYWRLYIRTHQVAHFGLIHPSNGAR